MSNSDSRIEILRNPGKMAKIKMLYKILLLHVLYGSILASNCGQSTIPFSFEALPDGQPVLGCARPTCFGWNPDGTIASKPATFYRINKKPDGYFRQSANIKPRAINVEEAPNFHPQTAECAATFESDHCPNENQWIGGIGPQINVSRQPFSVQCCSYKSLELSEDRGVATVNPGQIVIGGEILKEGGDRQYAFDYISDIIKHNREDGTVSYEVSIRRLPCLPYPNEFAVPIENTVPAEIIERFTKAEEKLKKNDLSKAFQASLLSENGIEGEAAVAAGQPQADVIEGPFVAEGETIQQVNSVDGYGVGAPGGYNLAPPSYQGPPPSYQGAPPQGGYAGGYGGGGGGGGGGSCSSNAGCSCVGSGCRCGNSGCGCSGGGCNCNGNGCGSQLLSYGGGAPQGGCGGSSCGGSGFYCFSGDTIVETSIGPKRMDELKLNDWVLSANGSEVLFTRIESWIHRLPSKKAEFLQLELEDGRMLKITSKHFIYKTECTAPGQTVLFHELTKQVVFAEKVQVGDCLYVLPNKNAKNFIQQRVKSIETVVEYGIYAPMTGNTDIVVNDIYASCYNIIYNKEMQRSFFRSIKRMPSLKSLLGFHEDEEEIPFGMSWIVEILQHVIPTSIFSSIGS
uniref:Uncharacterized protein n=1 Tax=Acrobeloides nanus TaxID=290746 RepID=A0A914DMP8_9BILA